MYQIYNYKKLKDDLNHLKNTLEYQKLSVANLTEERDEIANEFEQFKSY